MYNDIIITTPQLTVVILRKEWSGLHNVGEGMGLQQILDVLLTNYIPRFCCSSQLSRNLYNYVTMVTASNIDKLQRRKLP